MKSENPYSGSVLCLSVRFHSLRSSLESHEDVIAHTEPLSSCSERKRNRNGEIVCLTLMKGCNSLKSPKRKVFSALLCFCLFIFHF